MALTTDYGIHILRDGDTYESNPDDMYAFRVDYTGDAIELSAGDSAWTLTENMATVTRGPSIVRSPRAVTVIRGYAPRTQSVSLAGGTNLPYINGCSSEQLIAPVRPGDPTMQLLYIPPHSSEQAHHIHATARVVHVLEGLGKSIIGMDGGEVIELSPGMTLVLDRMVPHHFETAEQPLLVAPIHVWSSTPLEQGHPMFYGTIKT